ncbi:helix-turn-helix domain-containing protein [Candidatus Bathyarchaeota archaeon]|nr:helix-turn-helix domain-containing protein [Candidatus Bathyarchaeota archaeon]
MTGMAWGELDEEVYSSIFNALRHGVRRNIIRLLEDGEFSHTEIAEALGLSSSHLTYHLDAMQDLVSKTEHGYRLSRFGEAAVQMTKTVETPPMPAFKPEDKTRFKRITLVLSISLLVIAGATIGLFRLSHQRDQRMYLLGEKVDDFSTKLDKYTELENLLEESSSTVITKGRELSLDMKNLLGTGVKPGRFTMVFYVPGDNLSLSIETALNKPDDFYFPLTIQEGNALNPPEDAKSSGTMFQSSIYWGMNISSRFESIKIPLDQGWYTLSWVGPVNVSNTGTVYFDCSWGIV